MSLLLDSGGPASYLLVADPGTYNATGQPVTFTASFSLNASSGAYSVAGNAATLTASYNVVASPGTYGLTGLSATLAASFNLTASFDSYAITGSPAVLTANRFLSTDPSSYLLSGFDATLTYATTTVSYTLNAESSDYTITGFDVTFKRKNKSGVERLRLSRLEERRQSRFRPKNPPAPFISIDWTPTPKAEVQTEKVSAAIPVQTAPQESSLPLAMTAILAASSVSDDPLQAEALQRKQADQRRRRALTLLLMAA